VLCLTLFLLCQLISLYLSWPKQLILGSVCILLGVAANRLSTSPVVTLALMLISMTATLRYAWWRVRLLVNFFADGSNNRFGIDSLFMLVLISAEAYTILIMVLGYMQTMRPLRRLPIPLPKDESEWPHVDVLIPTYNEPLSLVRYTALAAQAIDYPPDKLHVYILDDGTRQEFRNFAEAAGVGYVTRTEHNHAKAGNINHALTTMNSPFVAIFDCDHVPTRSFLQMTLGWMLVDPLLAMMQTPHHFYSPDPFERNLLQYKTIPNEAELFYGIIQDGNDFWNATFFCGSCALLRRSALDKVGGIATETVTEDAHTSLRMQKCGFGTAYINIPQAAGLATETLAAHVGQRIRWARGMIQILRTDNPLIARGLKFTQRLCYFNAMAHFMYAVPRLVFLIAPLIYMLLGRTIIPGYWVAILAYALPHLILSSLTNSRIQGRHRHSFWNEIYEAVLAPYILAPTLLALINPKLGKFNVTNKGTTLSETQFDRKIATPTRWLLFLNFLGVLVAPYRLFISDPQHPGTVISNLVWIIFNMVILGVAAAVAHEQKQRRQTVRIEAKIRVSIHLPDGRRVDGMSIDMSVGGASIRLAREEHFAIGERFRLAFPEYAGDAEIGARVVGVSNGELRLAFSVPTIEEQETLTRALYSRADAWVSSVDSKEVDRPLVSLGRVIRLSFNGIYEVCKSCFPERTRTSKTRTAPTAAVILIACALGVCSHAFGGTPESQVLQSAIVAPDGQMENPPSSHPRAGEPGSGPPGSDATSTPADAVGNERQVISLKDMGTSQDIEMRGPHSYYSLPFTLSHSLVPRQAILRLAYSFDPGLDPRVASLTILVNGTPVKTLLPLPSSELTAGVAHTDVTVPSDLLVRNNGLTFEFTGSGVMQQDDQANTRVLGRIRASSTLEVSGDHLQLQNDLSKLPLPIFDSDLQSTTTVPFVFLAPPSVKTLQAAGIVASWLGLLAGSKPVRFTVVVGGIPAENAVLFSASRSSLPASLLIPPGTGPILALRNNPSDPSSSVLVLTGEDDDQLLTVARTLSLTTRATSPAPAQGFHPTGDTAQIPDLVMPPVREQNDSPRWLPLGRAIPLTNCQTPDRLQSDGSSPIPLYVHLPPELYYGERQNLKMHLHYRYNARQVAPGSALRMAVNGTLVSDIALTPGPDFTDLERSILVPVADMRPFGNTFLFNFDFKPARRDATQGPASGTLNGNILCNTSLDLQQLALWTRMPNLGLFADAGFPFTRFADLSMTTVILPSAPSPAEISLYLHIMSHFGTQTAYPVLRVTVTGPNIAIDKGRDYLILGDIDDQPAFNSLEAWLPVTFDANGVHVKPVQSHLSFFSPIQSAPMRWWSKLFGHHDIQKLPSNVDGMPDAMIEEIKLPFSTDRSIVLIALKSDSSTDSLESVFLDRSQSRDITDSVSLLRNSQFTSYQVSGEVYHVGDLSWIAMMRIWLTQYFVELLLVVTALSFLLASWLRNWLNRHAEERLKPAETLIASR